MFLQIVNSFYIIREFKVRLTKDTNLENLKKFRKLFIVIWKLKGK